MKEKKKKTPGEEIIGALRELKDDLEESMVHQEIKRRSDKLKERMDRDIAASFRPYVFEPVYWDNCPIEKLLAEIKKAIQDGFVDEKAARPYIWKLTAGQRPAFPGWRK